MLVLRREFQPSLKKYSSGNTLSPAAAVGRKKERHGVGFSRQRQPLPFVLICLEMAVVETWMLVRADIYLVAIEKWSYFWSMSRHNRTFSAKSFVRELSIKLKFFTEIDEFWLNSFLKKISDVEFGSDHNGTANHQPLSVWPAAWCLVHWPKIWSTHKTMQLPYPMVSCMFWGSTLLSIKKQQLENVPPHPHPPPLK